MDGLSTESDGNKNVIVMAATNRPWDIDDAIRRRLEKRIYIPLPTEKGRLELFKIYLKTVELTEENGGIDWEYLATESDGYSGADI